MYKILFKVAFGVLCLVGFVWQVEKVTRSYFLYSTTTKLTMDIPEYFGPPSLSLCFVYVDILELEHMFKKLNIETETSRQGWKQPPHVVQLVQNRSTLKHIFEFTPEVNYFITECSIRSAEDNEINSTGKAACLNYFNITKFFTQARLCYKIKLINQVQFDYIVVSSDLVKPGMAFLMTLNKTALEYVNSINIIVHGDALPYDR